MNAAGGLVATLPRGTNEVPNTLYTVLAFGPVSGLKKLEFEEPAQSVDREAVFGRRLEVQGSVAIPGGGVGVHRDRGMSGGRDRRNAGPRVAARAPARVAAGQPGEGAASSPSQSASTSRVCSPSSGGACHPPATSKPENLTAGPMLGSSPYCG